MQQKIRGSFNSKFFAFKATVEKNMMPHLKHSPWAFFNFTQLVQIIYISLYNYVYSTYIDNVIWP